MLPFFFQGAELRTNFIILPLGKFIVNVFPVMSIVHGSDGTSGASEFREVIVRLLGGPGTPEIVLPAEKLYRCLKVSVSPTRE